MLGKAGWEGILMLFMVTGAGVRPCQGNNVWTKLDVPPYIPCSLPACDPLCDHMENALGQICPRAASTSFKVYGVIPGPQACMTRVLNWIPGPKPSKDDPEGCGPCLLKDEKSICNSRNMGGRGFNAGGPLPRRGQTMVRYETPVRSKYVGAILLVLFGGVDRNDNFLNDVWFYCIDRCPTVYINKRTFDKFGVAIDYTVCPPGNCAWEEKGVNQEFIDWMRYKEERPSSILQRGIVPSRPAGRHNCDGFIASARGGKCVCMYCMCDETIRIVFFGDEGRSATFPLCLPALRMLCKLVLYACPF
jgi:hypothetical protein